MTRLIYSQLFELWFCRLCSLSANYKRALQDSLGGDAKAMVFLAVSPREDNIQETVSTLTFGKVCQQATRPAIHCWLSGLECEPSSNLSGIQSLQ